MFSTESRSGRRDFLNWLLGSSLGTLAVGVFYPALHFVNTPPVPDDVGQRSCSRDIFVRTFAGATDLRNYFSTGQCSDDLRYF